MRSVLRLGAPGVCEVRICKVNGMQRVLLILGWSVALVLAAFVVQQRSELNAQAALFTQLQQAVAAPAAEHRDVALGPADRPSVSVSARPPAGSTDERSEVARVQPETVGAAAERSNAEGSPITALVELMKGLTGDASSPQSRIMFETQYGELMDQLDLDAERREAVRLALTADLDRAIRMASELLSGGSDSLTEQAGERPSGPPSAASPVAGIREELGQYLSDAELAVYDAYAAGERERNLRRRYGMEIGMFAPNLSSATREQVLRVMVEENLESHSRDSTPREARPIETLDRAVKRLDQMLDPQAQSTITRFLRMQYMSVEMAAQLLERRALQKREAP